MHKFKKLLFLLFILTSTLPVNAVTWQTNGYGYWSNASTWMGGIVPLYTSADTFYINHPIVYDSTITLQQGAYFVIDTLGGICGHETVIVQTGAFVRNYGILQGDVLSIPGGDVYGSYGYIILTTNCNISNGGALHINGGGMSVGPWFNCIMPLYSFLTSVNEINTSTVNFYPNPATTEINIESETDINYIKITDVTGKSIQVNNNTGNSYSLSEMNPGLYFVSVFDNKNNLIVTQKILIAH